MKTFKKIVCTILVVLMLVTSAPLAGFVELEFPVWLSSNAATEAIIASGDCGANGDNITWTLYENGELVIVGEGEMYDTSMSSMVPWYSNRNLIKSVVISEGVTSIGTFSFSNCSVISRTVIFCRLLFAIFCLSNTIYAEICKNPSFYK